MMLSPSLHCIVIYYHKGPLAFKVLPFSPPAVYGSQSITASEERWQINPESGSPRSAFIQASFMRMAVPLLK